jgi:hypothetical protein
VDEIDSLRRLPLFGDVMRDVELDCKNLPATVDALENIVAAAKHVQQIFDESLERVSQLQQRLGENGRMVSLVCEMV